MDNFTYEYLSHRGISKDTFSFYDVKTKIDADGKPVSVGFQYPNGEYKVRMLDKKDFYMTSKVAGLFGRDKFSSGGHKSVTITEGEYDALALYQVIKSPVVSVQSASTGHRDCVADHAWLSGFERIYLAFDGDEAGRDCARQVAKLFDYNKVFIVKFTKRKDANEYLQYSEEDELRTIWQNSQRYLPEYVKSSLEEFKKILRERPKKGISYPFPILNEMTYGARTGESVLVTAPEGVGKTELMHAFEYNLLKGTDDAIGAIFLEEPQARHLQALAGLELRLPVHLPDTHCSEDEIVSALEKVVGKDDRLHIYSHFGSDDPDVIIDTIRFLVSARLCRWIILDHIGMVVSGLSGEDERRALDYLATRLEMMVKELDFGLILVSHVNDEGKTRGSRLISKIADIRIDVARNVTHPDIRERNKLYLNVTKNRFSGRTGPAGKLLFDPATFTLTEESSEYKEEGAA